MECFGEYDSTSCETINAALDCYRNNQLVCDQQFGVSFRVAIAQTDQYNNGCIEPEEPTTVLPSDNNTTMTALDTPSPDLCPSLPNIHHSNLSLSMSTADISPSYLPSGECTMTQVDALRQCSLFMDSQLRAFTRDGLETCSLPGSWYLLRHPSLSIEVEGTSMELGSNHTRLTKVNITFHSHNCNPEERSYVAYNMQPLPSDFTPSLVDNETSPLQLMYGQDQSVVTLMATWLNATVIIRQYSDFLSVTLRVPREMSLSSEGLCTGCPSHMYVNLTSFFDLILSRCPSDNTKALNSCFDYGGVANEDGLDHVHNNSYLEACVFNLFKTKTSEALSMINAIASDAKLLVNVGQDPRPVPTLPPLPHPSTDSSTTHSSTEVSSATSLHSPTCTLLLLILTISIFSITI